jgi:type IV fimbrial biogenesis protein FimT
MSVMNNYKGFTLIELMVTLAVAATLMAVAIPATKLWQANARVSATANGLAADIRRARGNALVTRRNHTMTAINTTIPSNQWGNGGWRVTQLVANVDTTVVEEHGVPPTVTITGVAVDSAGASASVSSLVIIGSTGRLQKTDGTPVNMTFKVCDSNVTTEVGYNVLMNQFGRLLVQKHLNAKDSNGLNDSQGCNT